MSSLHDILSLHSSVPLCPISVLHCNILHFICIVYSQRHLIFVFEGFPNIKSLLVYIDVFIYCTSLLTYILYVSKRLIPFKTFKCRFDSKHESPTLFYLFSHSWGSRKLRYKLFFNLGMVVTAVIFVPD